jgi:hypothetical protein
MNREGLPARLPAQSPAGGSGCALHALPARWVVQSPSVGCPHSRRPTNGAAFTVGVAADRRSSAPPPQPFLVVCVGLVCSVGCPRGCSNSLMLRRCGII